MSGDIKNKYLLLLPLLFIFHFSEAAKRYWVGNGSNKNWNTTANWSASSGGASGASVPGSNDTAYFNGSGTGQCILNASPNVKRIDIASGYTDTLKQNKYSITIGAGGFSQAGGVFYGDSTDISLTGVFLLSGGTFRSTKSTLTASSNFTFSGGTFSHNNGLVKFNASLTITGNITFYKLEFNSQTTTKTFTIASGTTIIANNDFTQSGNMGAIINTGNLHAKGDIYTDNVSGGGGSANVTINGTGDQSLYGGTSGGIFTGRLPNLTINKSSGNLYLYDNITILGNFTYTAGSITYGTSTVNFGATKTITGSVSLYNVTFSNGTAAATITISSGTSISANGTLSFNGSTGTGWALTVNTGTINAYGDITDVNPNSGGGGSALLNINGTGSQTLTGSGSEGGHALPNVTINKGSGTLTVSGIAPVAGNWTYTAGTVSSGTSTVVFTKTSPTISGTHTLSTVVMAPTAASTVTVSNALTLTADLKIKGNSNAITINTGTMNIAGNLYITNSSTSGGGSAYVVLNGSSSQTVYGNTNGKGYLPNFTIDKSGGDVTIDSSITIKGITSFNGSSNYQLNGTHGGNLYTSFSDITLGGSSKLNGGSGTIQINGSSVSQTLSGSGNGLLPKVTINKSGSNALTISGSLNVGNDWTYTAGTLTTTGSTVSFNNSLNINGSHSLNNVSFAPIAASTITVNSSSVLSVNGTLTLAGNYPITINTGTINAGGDISVTNTTTAGGGSTWLTINGTSAQTITGTSGSSAAPFSNVKINKSSGTLSLSGNTLSFGGDLVHSAGTTTVSASNTVYLYNTGSLNAPSITFNNISQATGTRSLAGNLNIAGNLSILSNSVTPVLDASGGAYTINLQGNWSNSGAFKSGTGYLNFNGSGTQTITQPGGANDSISKIQINKSSGTLSLSSKVNISDTLKFASGSITSDTTNLLVLWKRAKVSGNSSTKFVNGPIKKIGNSAFTFPVGKNGVYKPFAITAPSSPTDAYVGEYFSTGQTFGSTTGDSISGISTCEYWKLNRATGTSTVSITLSWTSDSCQVDTSINMRVASWDGSQWNNEGGLSPTGNRYSGSVTSIPVPTTVFPIGHYVPIVLTKLCRVSITISSSVPSDTICSGDSLLLTANTSGTTLYPITSYTWTNSNNPGTVNTSTLEVNTTGNYTITASNALGCRISKTAHVAVISVPLTVNSDTICRGDTVTLTASGAVSYSWTPSTHLSSTSSNPVLAWPDSTILYTLTGTSYGCSKVVTATVTVVQTLSITVNSFTIFIGGNATLVATGASNYTWTPSTALDVTTGSVVHSTPTVTTVYTIHADSLGCTGIATSTVTVIPDTIPTSGAYGCNCVSDLNLDRDKKYIIGAWASEDGALPTRTSFTYPEIYIDFADGSGAFVGSSGPFKPDGKIIDGWQRIESPFTVPVGAFYMILRLQSTSGDVLFDDIRLFPSDASMKGYVYDQQNLRLVAELDERNYATHYEYDEEGKLTRVKKETERGNMTIKESRNSAPKQ